MDLSKLSDKDLEALSRGDVSAMSDEALEMLAGTPRSTGEELVRQLGLTARAGISGLAALPNIIADPFYRMAGATPPAQGLQQSLTALGLPEPETNIERLIQPATEAVAGAGGQIGMLGRLAQTAISPTTRAVSQQAAQAPTSQLAAASVAAPTSQVVTQETESPLLGMAAGLAAGGAAGVRRQPTQTPFAQQLRKEAEQAYNLAERAGLSVNQSYVKDIADKVSKKAFEEGFDPGLHPQVSAVLNRLTDEGTSPKTLQELERLRRIVRAPGKDFNNPDQQRIASEMIDEFDSLVENVGTQNVNVAGSKDLALSALTRARDIYKKSRKVSIIEDMVDNATTRASQQTQAGLDNTLRNQFVNLATNKKRMASFTKAEQDEIKRIARGGGNTQQMLRFVGRFAVRGPVSGVFAGGATAYEPMLGIPVTIAAEGAKRGAEALRQRDVSRLMEQIAQRPMARQPSLVPITATRGLLSSQME